MVYTRFHPRRAYVRLEKSPLYNLTFPEDPLPLTAPRRWSA